MSCLNKSRVFTWHLFARVIDNLGDAGVAWRLARQLVLDYQQVVVLFLDDWAALALIEPRLVGACSQANIDGVTLLCWESECSSTPDIVLEVLGCRPPAEYLRSLIAKDKKFLWVDWEYLSAESWVEALHLTHSWQAEYHYSRYYFCPGFTLKTGGLLREKDLLIKQNNYRQGNPRSRGGPQRMLVFSYDLSPLWSLEENPEKPAEIWLMQGELCVSLSARWQVQPMVPQTQFDTYLWSCDLNAVRGEDSFVRAQWTGVPMLWQIYPQKSDAHWVKLDAFLALYLASASVAARIAINDLFYAWNGRGIVTTAWQNMLPHWDEWQQLSRQWASFLISQPDNGQQLLNFVASNLS